MFFLFMLGMYMIHMGRVWWQLITMEGREAKHIALHRLSVNTTYQQRWQESFRHEFIMLVWLPDQGHKSNAYSPSKSVYIPPRVLNDNRYCYCGLEKADPADQKCCTLNDWWECSEGENCLWFSLMFCIHTESPGLYQMKETDTKIYFE